MLSIVADPAPCAEAGIVRLAPAKINLALHVTGQRQDGYHLIESIVTFADFGDRLSFVPAAADRFTVSGRFGGFTPKGAADNLVLKARDLLRSSLRERGIAGCPVAIHLEKNLPVAAGIGGGSADAAAALTGLLDLWNAELAPAELEALGLKLGADVPMCLKGEPLMAKGIGEHLTPLPDLPSLSLVLGNPLVGVSTPAIFGSLAVKNNPPLRDRGAEWVSHLQTLRNDLEPPARALVAEIEEISNMIRAEGALMTRMSGSGATCFGIFGKTDEAQRAEKNLIRLRPDWFFKAVQTKGIFE